MIIPTLNGANTLKDLLKRVLSQNVKIIEVIVIDSQSTDSTINIAEKYGAKTITVNRAEFDHGGTRNYAALNATGNVLVFMTQDALPENQSTFEYLLRPLNDPDIIVSYARQIPKPNTKITDQFLRLYNYPVQGLVKSREDINQMGIKCFQNSNVCSAYRAKEFNILGGFPTPVVSNEDMLFAAKAILNGYKVAYTAEAKVLHSHNYNLSDLFKRYFDIGASLENEPLIKQVGKVESKGLGFVINQLQYVTVYGQIKQIPNVFLEAVYKYAGFKIGQMHRHIPTNLKKQIGLNKTYWTKH